MHPEPSTKPAPDQGYKAGKDTPKRSIRGTGYTLRTEDIDLNNEKDKDSFGGVNFHTGQAFDMARGADELALLCSVGVKSKDTYNPLHDGWWGHDKKECFNLVVSIPVHPTSLELFDPFSGTGAMVIEVLVMNHLTGNLHPRRQYDPRGGQRLHLYLRFHQMATRSSNSRASHSGSSTHTVTSSTHQVGGKNASLGEMIQNLGLLGAGLAVRTLMKNGRFPEDILCTSASPRLPTTAALALEQELDDWAICPFMPNEQSLVDDLIPTFHLVRYKARKASHQHHQYPCQ